MNRDRDFLMIFRAALVAGEQFDADSSKNLNVLLDIGLGLTG